MNAPALDTHTPPPMGTAMSKTPPGKPLFASRSKATRRPSRREAWASDTPATDLLAELVASTSGAAVDEQAAREARIAEQRRARHEARAAALARRAERAATARAAEQHRRAHAAARRAELESQLKRPTLPTPSDQAPCDLASCRPAEPSTASAAPRPLAQGRAAQRGPATTGVSTKARAQRRWPMLVGGAAMIAALVAALAILAPVWSPSPSHTPDPWAMQTGYVATAITTASPRSATVDIGLQRVAQAPAMSAAPIGAQSSKPKARQPRRTRPTTHDVPTFVDPFARPKAGRILK